MFSKAAGKQRSNDKQGGGLREPYLRVVGIREDSGSSLRSLVVRYYHVSTLLLDSLGVCPSHIKQVLHENLLWI